MVVGKSEWIRNKSSWVFSLVICGIVVEKKIILISRMGF